ncbi:MAG TPA: ROK family transcriptional regulator [Pseudonocardia sp.]|uniref:ROK family transcriptional regulator n=1 Tax=Pseudonocardia sp. TaxID=60912 RepID=UPI002B4B0AAD|nr:ROK family transcriptional regulator [Pseudonocardia sp.]HLU56379.1 ROK family transcriptional regulator [Pseudonocardia sp.]
MSVIDPERVGPGNPVSAGRLLLLVRKGVATTRRDLIRVTGLSRSTVTQRVDALLGAGLLRESAGEAEGRGRPAGALSFDEGAGHVLVASVRRDRVELHAVDLGARELHRREFEMSVAEGPEVVLEAVETELDRLVADAGLDPARTAALGVGVPGPVDVSVGRVMQPPVMPGWHDYPVRDRLAERLGVPVFVENDANLMALGEQRANWPDVPALLLVTVGSGIGAGIVIDGRLYRGIDGGAGDIGHIRMHGYDDRCACGAVGCLAAVASGDALARKLAAMGKDVGGVADVRRLVHGGDPDAIAAVRTAGQLAGEVLTTVVSVLNPEILVLAGEMAETNEYFVTGMREMIYQRSLPRATRRLRVVTTALGDRATVIGMTELVVDEVFAPEAVDARLGTR